MKYICIFFKKTSFVFFTDFQIPGKETLSLFDDEYEIVAQNLCFDWIVGDSEDIIWIDFNFSGSEDFWLENEKKELKNVFDFSFPNARFWFGTKKTGKKKFCCDWEDYYFRSKRGVVLICVRTHLLNDTELTLLKKQYAFTEF